MKYYCFYLDCGDTITKTTIIMTENSYKINAVQRVLYELGYDNKIVDDINEFVEFAKDKTSQIKLIML